MLLFENDVRQTSDRARVWIQIWGAVKQGNLPPVRSWRSRVWDRALLALQLGVKNVST